jgi:hypothetical protein
MGQLFASDYPSAEITNGQVKAVIYLPDGQHGFYRGTRFDWSGVVSSLQFQGHDYYGPWFNKTGPDVHDFVYDGPDIVAGPCSAITGPVDEFAPLGFEDAKAGGNFIKIGIGALRKPDDQAYDHYRSYEVADPGKWSIGKHADSVEFTQELHDASSGYGYTYRKTLRLVSGKAEMVLEHSLKNTGTQVIHTSVYNHNFLVLDGRGPGPGVTITVPFQIHTSEPTPKPPAEGLAEIRGNQIIYRKTLEGHDVAAMPLQGFGASAADHQFRIEDTRAGAGMSMESDRPLSSESLWSIRTVIAVEPYVEIAIEPGSEFTWTSSYRYYSLKSEGGAQ